MQISSVADTWRALERQRRNCGMLGALDGKKLHKIQNGRFSLRFVSNILSASAGDGNLT